MVDSSITIEKTKIDKREYEFVKDFIFTEEMKEEAIKIIEDNQECLGSSDKFLNLQARNWDKFYKHNTTNFFKDRHYILNEFPELAMDNREKVIFLDCGCGVGNTFYPILEKKDNVHIKGFDISKKAIDMSIQHRLYKDFSNRIDLICLDLVKEDIPKSFENANYSILMFVLSAIMPSEHENVLKKIYNSMDKQGVLYFRDYARYDMAQIRFSMRKKNKVEDNLYIRHDKTLVYYFQPKEIEEMFIKIGFKVIENKTICRLIENRKDNKKMHRLWLQMKVVKE